MLDAGVQQGSWEKDAACDCPWAARIVFVTVHCDPIMVERSFAVGALGYVVKRTAGDELVPAVRSALSGERHAALELSSPGDVTRTL